MVTLNFLAMVYWSVMSTVADPPVSFSGKSKTTAIDPSKSSHYETSCSNRQILWRVKWVGKPCNQASSVVLSFFCFHVYWFSHCTLSCKFTHLEFFPCAFPVHRIVSRMLQMPSVVAAAIKLWMNIKELQVQGSLFDITCLSSNSHWMDKKRQ